MSAQPIFEKINYFKNNGEYKEQIKVECKTDVPASNLASVLSLTAFVSPAEATVANGQIEYGGKAMFYLAYVDQEGEIKKAECGTEFSGLIKDAKITESCRADVCYLTEKTEVDTAGVKVSVYAYLTIKAEIIEKCEREALVSGEDLIVDTREVSHLKSLGQRQANYPIEEEFELDYTIKEVLYHRAHGVITNVQCGVGTIIVDGETQIDLIVLQKSEKSVIIKETRKIPFRAEIECEDAMPTTEATARVKEKSFKTEVLVDENTGKSTVTVSVLLKFYGEAFANESLVLARDVFSTSMQTETEQERVCYYRPKEQRAIFTNVTGRAVVGELPVGASLMAIGGEKAELISSECDGEKLKVLGVICGTGYFSDGESKVFTRKIEFTFEQETELSIPCEAVLDVGIGVKSTQARIISLTELDVSGEIVLTVYPKENCEISFIKGVNCTGEKKAQCSAISVYIPEEGEELWSLAKRLSVNPEKLIETNKELCFPLTGKERIVVYR